LQSSAPFRSRLLAAAGGLILVVTAVGAVAAADPPGLKARDGGRAWDAAPQAAAERFVIEFRVGTKRAERDAVARAEGLTKIRSIRGTRQAVYVASGAKASVASIRKQAPVASVRRSLQSTRDVEPTDPGWTQGLMWGIHNTGQSILGQTGVSDVDVDAKSAWNVTTGSSNLVVAVIDDGVDFSHPDLAGRAWINPGETGPDAEEGVDDDENGYIDDINGWDFCHDDNTVHDFDDDFHGTHVAGTIAASLNGQGIVGVAPSIKIMALKFLGDDPECGWDDQAADALAYAKSFGVRISNNSWGRRGGTTLENLQLYEAVRDSDMLFVSSAGNSGINNDTNSAPAYPASFDLPNILSVGAVDNRGRLASFSNYGKTRVDVFAPGVSIVSALPADSQYPVGYGWLDGTSMAAPHVTGVAALIASEEPGLLSTPGVASMKARIMNTGKKLSAVVGKSVTDTVPSALRALDTTSPTSMPPTSHAFVVDSVLGTGITTRIGWPAATDDLSGINFYAVQQQTNLGAWSTLMTANTTRSIDRPLTIASTYRFQVRAKDRAGNYGTYAAGPLVQPGIYQEGTAAARYGGTWTSAKSSTASGGRTRYATKAGAWVEFSFTGRGIAVVAPKGSSRGSVKVYIDGVYIKTVSAYRSSGRARVIVFSKAWASSAGRKIKLVVVGTSGHPRFDIDAFVILRQL
jgi:subtilisin family serine protease